MRTMHSGMDVRVKAAFITLVVAGVSFPLTFVVWPPLVPPWAPVSALALGYGLVAAECLAMGGGFAFLAFGFPMVKRLPVSPRLAFASYLGIGYFLVNWWTHDHLHAVTFSLEPTAFIWMSVAIEYVFHAAMMVFGGVLALFFARILLAPSASGATAKSEAVPTLAAIATEEVMVG
jgi:hypothetical protein